MNGAIWKDAASIFDVAVILDGSDREDYLNLSCAHDPALLSAVRELLIADSEEMATNDVIGAQRIIDLVTKLKPGDNVESWKVLRELGSGGMGTVYLAERCDSEVEQLVAIKVLQYGVDANRFRIERQVLANLSHPNIAGFLHGGSLHDGRPFVVMEYVDGMPIDKWCEQNNADLSLRLKIFLSLCSAVDHAHRNLVVHRDIKPANVLVDKNGEPKLLDFGIVKVLSEDGRIQSVEKTGANVRLMTRAYASPEQILGGRVTTATDIFSLAILFHEILYGVRPACTSLNDPAELLAAAPVRDLWVGDVPLLKSCLTARYGAMSRTRQAELGAIIFRALRFDPDERYGSVAALSVDVKAFMEHRPVSAQKRSAVYLIRKYVERNRRQAAAVALLVVTSITSFMVAWMNFSNALKERDLAISARQSEQLQSEVLLDALRLANADFTNRPLSLDEMLTQAREKLLDASKQFVSLSSEVYLVLAKALISQSRFDEARDLLAEAIQIDSQADNRGGRLLQSYYSLAHLEIRTRNFGAAKIANDAAQKYFQDATGDDLSLQLALQEAVIVTSSGNPLVGVASMEFLAEEVHAEFMVDRSVQRELFLTLASSYDLIGEKEKWEGALTNAVAFSGPLEADDPGYLDLLIDLARLDSSRKEYDLAMMKLTEADRLIAGFHRSSHPQRAKVTNRIGNIHYFRGDYLESLEAYRKAIQIQERLVGELDRNVIHWIYNTHLPMEKMGDLVGASIAVQDAVNRYRKLEYLEGSELAYFLLVYGELQERIGEFDMAEQSYRESISLSFVKARNSDVSSELGEAQCRLGLNLAKRGVRTEAVVWLRRCGENGSSLIGSELFLDASRELLKLVGDDDV